jgi:serine/threonine-protein kinase
MRKICLRCDSKFGSQADYCPHDGTLLITDDEVPDPLIGTVLLEQFRIDALIGTGGMGTVYRARQTTVGRDVAVKVLRIELARDENAVRRFEREARLATSLDHPNLVQVFLSGRLSDGRIYIVMELLEGRSLADELDEQGVPSVERALVIVMKLCAGLGAVHAKGIVHRDIKPENVYLVRRGTDEDFVKLVDFGISRALDTETVSTDSQSGRVFGTAAYISPEAATGDPTDGRSDIYSIGVLTYQLLTGVLPFEGKTAGAVLMQHVHEEPPPMHTKGSGEDVPGGVAQVIMHALAKDPEARFQTLSEFVDTLAEAAVDAGLLTDARALLLGTVWGDELAAPGSFLADLLGASSLPGMADTLALTLDRNPEEEALLSSAPKPFGTSSFETAKVGGSRRRQGWLWASLGALAVVLVGAVAGTWWVQRAQRATATEPAVAPETVVVEEPTVEEPVADVGTDQPQEPLLVIPEAEAEPKAKPKKKRRKSAKKRTVPASAPMSAPAPASAPTAEDDGIDWTAPGFPEEGFGDEGSSPEAPPTGTPDAPPRNPVVIDEVPGRESR